MNFSFYAAGLEDLPRALFVVITVPDWCLL